MHASSQGPSPSYALLAAGLVTTLALVGCVSLPRTGAVAATGEPLSVGTKTVYDKETYKEKVGEVTFVDSQGQKVGTSTLYAKRTEYVPREVWQTYQGATPLDDQDFFRLAGDTDAVDRIRRTREQGVTFARVGLVGTLLGLGVTTAGFALKDDAPNASNGLPTALLVGGTVTAGVGALLWALGVAAVKGAHPLDDQQRAFEAAARYNASLNLR